MKHKIIEEKRVDKYHTLVIWDNVEINDFTLLNKVIHNIKIVEKEDSSENNKATR